MAIGVFRSTSSFARSCELNSMALRTAGLFVAGFDVALLAEATGSETLLAPGSDFNRSPIALISNFSNNPRSSPSSIPVQSNSDV